MKIKNIGSSNFMLKDKRGNLVILEPSGIVDVKDDIGAKYIRIYPFIKEVQEKKVEVKEEVKEELKEVKVEPKKKSKRKKDGISNIG